MTTATETAGLAYVDSLEDRMAAMETAIAGLSSGGGGGYTGIGIYNVKDYGAVGDNVADDTAAIQAAIDACKAATYHGIVYLPPGTYSFTRLNLTNIGGGLTLEGAGMNATRLFPRGHASYGTTTGHLLDCTGSKLKLKGLQIGYFNQPHVPATAIFLAQTAGGTSDMCHFEDVYVSGSYHVATIYNFGVPSSSMVRCQVYNYHTAPAQYVAIWTKTNISGLSSAFAAVQSSGTVSMSDWTFTACEWHRFGGLAAGICWVWDGVSNLTYIGGNITAGGAGYIWASGVCKFVYVVGTTFETESMPMPANVILCTGSLSIHFPPTHEDITGTRFGGPGSVALI